MSVKLEAVVFPAGTIGHSSYSIVKIGRCLKTCPNPNWFVKNNRFHDPKRQFCCYKYADCCPVHKELFFFVSRHRASVAGYHSTVQAFANKQSELFFS